jgi:type III secretion system (T3SS) SseB-like protein
MNPPLQETLAALHAGQVSLADVREVLRQSDVLVPKPTGTESSQSSVTLPVIDYEEAPTVPLFSSLETFSAAAREGAGYVAIAFEGLMPAWPEGVGAVFDPGQPWALHVSSNAMKEPAPIQPGERSEVLVGEPTVEPVALLEQLSRHLRTLPQVQAAWRALIVLEGPGELPHLAIGLGLVDGAEGQAALERVGAFAATVVDGPLDLLIVEEGDPVADYMLELEPFYRRDDG